MNCKQSQILVIALKVINFFVKKLIAILAYKYSPMLTLTVSSHFKNHQKEKVTLVVLVLPLFLTLNLLQLTFQTDLLRSEDFIITMHKAIALLAIFVVVAASLADGSPMR